MTKNETVRKKGINVVVAAIKHPFAGPVPAGFRSVTDAWKRICGGQGTRR